MSRELQALWSLPHIPTLLPNRTLRRVMNEFAYCYREEYGYAYPLVHSVDPLVATMSRKLKLSPRQLWRHIARLVELGYIENKTKGHVGRGQNSRWEVKRPPMPQAMLPFQNANTEQVNRVESPPEKHDTLTPESMSPERKHDTLALKHDIKHDRSLTYSYLLQTPDKQTISDRLLQKSDDSDCQPAEEEEEIITEESPTGVDPNDALGKASKATALSPFPPSPTGPCAACQRSRDGRIKIYACPRHCAACHSFSRHGRLCTVHAEESATWLSAVRAVAA